MKHTAWTLGILLSLSAATASAATPLTLDEALHLAVSQHPSVAVRMNQREAASEALNGARRGLWPSLAAQTGKDAYGKDQLTLRVEQPLWTGGRLTAEIAGADANLQAAEAQLIESRQDIMLRAANTYTELGRVEARQAAARINVAEHERLHAQIQRRIEGQVTSGSDGLLADARLSQARAELAQLQALGARARATLEQIVGRPVGTIESAPPQRASPANLDATLDAASGYSPTLQRLAAQEKIAEAQVRASLGQALPQVKLRHDQTQGGQQAGGQTYVGLEYQTGAGLNILSAMKQAESRRMAARAERDAALRETQDAVRADWSDWSSLTAQASELDLQVKASEQVYDSFVRQYAVGRKSWLEVLNAQRELSQARYALADVHWGALRTLLKLQLATGALSTTTAPGTIRSERHD